MKPNLVGLIGKIRFAIFDDSVNSLTKNIFFDVTIGNGNYQRVTVPPGVWVAFSGISYEYNLLLNLANLEHDPAEVERKENLSEIVYNWF
ncbi:hypothetical protein [Cognataquiflexum aquatile]|uniref:hypothetical protein n=1 Tax=Cognataquiflexum aquatile TaxID=2249427 RepID=UPI000DEAECA4|nr:hypothetical protein [Cognataquiflexum aquatile]